MLHKVELMKSTNDYVNVFTNYPTNDLAGTLEAGGNTINDPSFNPWVKSERCQ